MRAALVALVVALVAAAMAPSAALAGADGDRDVVRNAFLVPPRDVGCEWIAYDGASTLRCDQRGKVRPQPPRPMSCTLGDWGFGVTLRRTGRPAFVCAGDNIVDTTAPVLRVGRTWRNGGIACASLKGGGLRCSNAAGHGFVVSPTRWRLF